MEWKVRFVDYPQQFQKWGDKMMAVIHTCLLKGDLMLRHQLEEFEKNLAAYVGTKYAVGLSNCTDALHLAMRAAGIKTGDEVITVSHTFVATAEAIHQTGATSILIDIGDDHNMNVDLIEAAITPKTKAIVPVHLNGRVCKMDKILSIAQKHNLIVIEDSAQALGGEFKGKRGGSFGVAGCFSFYPAKALGAFGDAGAMTTNSEEIYNKVHSLRDHGRGIPGEVSGWAYNCRLDNVQAAVLDLKLKWFPEWVTRRREIAKLYYDNLAGLKNVQLLPDPSAKGDHFDIYQNYEIEAENRMGLGEHLKSKGVEIMIPWGGKGVHQFKNLGLPQYKLPRTERMFERALMLPLTTELTNSQIQYVCEQIHEFYSTHGKK